MFAKEVSLTTTSMNGLEIMNKSETIQYISSTALQQPGMHYPMM